jgi:FkbM family methyltransferase
MRGLNKERIRTWLQKLGRVTPRLARFLFRTAYLFPRLYLFVANSTGQDPLTLRRVWHIHKGPLAGFKITHLLPQEIAPVLANRMEICCSSLLTRLSLQSGIVLDVGGSYGYYALLLSRLVGEKGRIYSFEPDWHSFERLTHNLCLNNIKNVIAVPVCASSVAVGLVPWASFEDEPWNSRLTDDLIEGDYHRLTAVPVTTLDDFADVLHILDKIRLVKIDVEGAELKVLQGAIRLLGQSKPLVLCELHGTEIAEQVFAFLSERGYQREMIEYMSEKRQHILAFPSNHVERFRALISESLH